jgi:hypothetical protein
MYKILHKKLGGGGVGSEEHICVLSSQIISQHVRERERERERMYYLCHSQLLHLIAHHTHHTTPHQLCDDRFPEISIWYFTPHSHTHTQAWIGKI